jgi:hypothetical protein
MRRLLMKQYHALKLSTMYRAQRYGCYDRNRQTHYMNNLLVVANNYIELLQFT